MKSRFTAILEQGEKYLIASCPEVPEAVGQGLTEDECLDDLAGSIRSVLDYRRAQALEHLQNGAWSAVVEVA